MAVLPKTAEWIDDIDGINIGDPVSGGESGAVNLRLASLAKRTEFLKTQLVRALDEIAAVEKLVGGITVSDALLKTKNLADVPNKATARANLGVASADHSHNAAYLKISESLSDVLDPAAALVAIGAAAKGHTHEQYVPYIIGEYKLMSHSAISAGWVKSNGGLYSIANHPKAFAIYGTKHGGDGITTFAVPDWRADAVRINDDGRGIDSGRVVGSEQEGAVESHTHEYRDRYYTQYSAASGMNNVPYKEPVPNGNYNANYGPIEYDWNNNMFLYLDSETESEGGTETRMRNRSCYMYVYIGRPGIDA